MTPTFAISDDRLLALAATRQGRVSIAGFTYQAAYAVARMASMATARPVLQLADIPSALRYDWAEDLDEIDEHGWTVLTQCKRINDIGQPASLADVILSFAPKLLWMPPARRQQLRFRLVCIDPRYAQVGPIAFTELDRRVRESVAKHVEARLAAPPRPSSDRALWQGDADQYGHAALAQELWTRSEVLYLPADTITTDPASPLLRAEQEAMDLLHRERTVDPAVRADALGALRGLLHADLLRFDPLSETPAVLPRREPQIIDRAHVHSCLLPFRNVGSPLPFLVIDRRFLEKQADKPKHPFVARQPEWADVLHGEDPTIKFVERTRTTEVLDEVRSTLLAPLARGTAARLNALFVTGAPGAGKSTLVRRVAALLVERSEVVVADPGPNLDQLGDDEVERVIEALSLLAQGGRPVLLLLDDPFFAESNWVLLLRHLGRPGVGPRIGVLGATPEFLMDQHEHLVTGKQVALHRFRLGGSTDAERRTLAAFHGQEVAHVAALGEEFLVLSMTAAAGQSFDEIMDRIWSTLNEGSTIPASAGPRDLPWRVRAYLVCCYFHRVYLFCPEALLLKVLESSEGEGTPPDFIYELANLELREGWRVFSTRTVRFFASHHRREFGTIHQRVASAAWQRRPVPALDLANWIIQASVRAEVSAYHMGELLSALIIAGEPHARVLVDRTAMAWNTAASEHEVEVRHLVEICSGFERAGLHDEAAKFTSGLEASLRSQDKDSWIAALQLRRMQKKARTRHPSNTELVQMINVADFSIAPGRAIQFANLLGSETPALAALTQRLLLALDGGLSWQLDSALLTWLLAKGPRNQLAHRVPAIVEQVRGMAGKSNPRAACLALLHELRHPTLHSIMRDTLAWLGNGQGRLTAAAALVRFAAESPIDLQQEIMRWAVTYLRAHLGDRSAELLVSSFLSLYRDLAKTSLKAEVSGSALNEAREAIFAWYASTGQRRPALTPRFRS